MVNINNFLVLTLILLLNSCDAANQQRSPSSIITDCSRSIKRLFTAPAVSYPRNYKLYSTLGMEFEGVLPFSIRYKAVAEEIQKKLLDMYPESGVTVKDLSYAIPPEIYVEILEVHYQVMGKKHVITVKNDNTVVGSFIPARRGIEITSTVMSESSEVNDFVKVLSSLVDSVSLKEAPKTGGIHVHYGLKRKPSLKKTIFLYKALDKLYDSVAKEFTINKRRDFLGRERLQNIIKTLEEHQINKSSREEVNNTLDARSLIRFVEKFGTVEMRVSNSTLNENELHRYTDFVNRFFYSWESESKKLTELFERAGDVEFHEVMDII